MGNPSKRIKFSQEREEKISGKSEQHSAPLTVPERNYL